VTFEFGQLRAFVPPSPSAYHDSMPFDGVRLSSNSPPPLVRSDVPASGIEGENPNPDPITYALSLSLSLSLSLRIAKGKYAWRPDSSNTIHARRRARA
jgi:hypothetical protein